MHRLASAAAFRRVYASGRVYRLQGLGLRVAPQADDVAGRHARLGIAIHRAVVRTNVRRNRWKRWIREVFRRHPEAVQPAWDIVITLAAEAPPSWRYHDVEAAVLELLARARRGVSP